MTTTKEIENAAAIAQVISDRINKDSALISQWKQHASPQARDDLANAKQDILIESLSTAAADTKEKSASATKLFNAMVKRTEIVAGVLATADADFEGKLVRFFSAIKNSKKAEYAELDLGLIYDAMGAPTLADAARKARALNP